MKAVVATFNQEKALVEAFSVIVQPVVEPMDQFAALNRTLPSDKTVRRGRADGGGRVLGGGGEAEAAGHSWPPIQRP